MVRVLGDVSGLAKSFKDTGDKAGQAAKSARAAFSGMLGMLNQSGVLGPFGEALAGADEAMSQIAEHGKKVSDVMLGAGGALVATGGLFAALGSKEQAAHQQLAQAIENTGHSYEDYGKAIEEAIKHNERFGQSSEATQNALQTLTQATGDPAKALNLLSTATDLAAAKHEDLVSAATAVGKVYNGNTKLLKEFGIQVTNVKSVTAQAATATKQSQAADDNLARAKRSLADIELVDSQRKKLTLGQQIQIRNAQEAVTTATTKASEAHQHMAAAQAAATAATKNQHQAVTELANKLHGQAAAAADTFTGHLKAIKTEIEDQAAKFGQKYGPALQGAGAAMAGLGTAMKIGQAAMAALTPAAEAAAAANDTLAASETAADVAGAPILLVIGLIVAAAAALVAIGYVVWRNWSTIWGAIKAVIKDVYDWIRNNWPLLLGILLGPVGLAVYFIYKYRDQIIDAFIGVWNWLTTEWSKITGDITAPFDTAWQAIQSGWTTAVNWISSTVNTVGQIFADIGNAILTPFYTVFNAIAWAWNHTIGAISFKVPSWVPGLGGKGFAMPQMPVLSFEQGGTVPYTGLIYAHQGETVIPAAKRPGPAIVINNAHFADTLDVELFMRRAAWAVQTTGV
jgi:hypothetical protein